MYSTVQWFVSVLEKQRRDKAARCGALPWHNPPRGPQEMQHSQGQAVPGYVQTGCLLLTSPIPDEAGEEEPHPFSSEAGFSAFAGIFLCP